MPICGKVAVVLNTPPPLCRGGSQSCTPALRSHVVWWGVTELQTSMAAAAVRTLNYPDSLQVKEQQKTVPTKRRIRGITRTTERVMKKTTRETGRRIKGITLRRNIGRESRKEPCGELWGNHEENHNTDDEERNVSV